MTGLRPFVSCSRLGVDGVERRGVRVEVSPGPSLFALAADVVGARRGVPEPWVAAARAELEPGDLVALAPIGAPLGRFCPGCVNAVRDHEPGGMPEILEAIADLPEEILLDDILFAFGPEPPSPWDTIARRPRPWLVRYARALGRAWNALRQPWTAAMPLLDRQLERAHTATAHHALPELLASLHPGAHLDNGDLAIPNTDPRPLHAPVSGIRLFPILARSTATRIHYDHQGDLLAILYPLPDIHRVLTGDILPATLGLDTLIGTPRAIILRLLDRPRHVGHIANALIATPSAATYQLRALEASGLIIRQRTGRQVMVHRTARGTQLLHLYNEHDTTESADENSSDTTRSPDRD